MNTVNRPYLTCLASLALSSCASETAEAPATGTADVAAADGTNSDDGESQPDAAAEVSGGDTNASDAADLDTTGSDTTGSDTIAPAPLLASYTLGADAYPESVEFDPTSRRFFTTSLQLGNVTQIDGVTGAVSPFFAGNGEPEWVGLGMQVDAPRRRLWVCAAYTKSLVKGEVWLLDLDTGARLARLDLSKTADAGSCTDFALADDGGVYVTDRQAGRLYHITGEVTGEAAPTVSVAVEDPELAPVVIGQNGVVLHPNQRVLVSGKYLPIRLERTDLTDPLKPVVTPFELDFSFLSGGADDMVLSDGKLYVIVEDRVVEITFGDADWTTAAITNTTPIWKDGDALVGGFSGIAAAEGALYAARSDVVLWGFGSASERPFVVRRVPGVGVAPRDEP